MTAQRLLSFHIPFNSDKYSLEDTEKLLQIWIKMSANAECVAPLLDGLAFSRESTGASGSATSVSCLRALLDKAQQREACLLEKSISTLLHSLAQVESGIVLVKRKYNMFITTLRLLQTCFDQIRVCSDSVDVLDRATALRLLSKLLRLSLDVLDAQSSMHFTALSLVNKIVDVTVLEQTNQPWSAQDGCAKQVSVVSLPPHEACVKVVRAR